MANIDILSNISDSVAMIPMDFSRSFDNLFLILKAIGIVAIIYVIYLIAMGILNFYRTKKLKVIEKKINSLDKRFDSLDKKLNKLLKKKK